MRFLGPKMYLGFVLAAALSAAQTPVNVNPTPRPAVTPKPPVGQPAKPPLTSAPASRVFSYSPTTAIDFGTVNFNASSRRTFSLTAPTDVTVVVRILHGGFDAVELRRLPPRPRGSSTSVAMSRTRPVRFGPLDEFYNNYQWTLAAGEEIQLDIVCTPNYNPSHHVSMAGGPFNFDGVYAMQVTSRATKP